MINYTVLDADLNFVQKAESLPITLKDFEIKKAFISNTGNKVFYYVYDRPDIKLFSTRGLLFLNNNQQPSFYEIELADDNHAGNLTLSFSEFSNKLLIGGEYYGKEFRFSGQGVMLAEVDWTAKKITNLGLYPYTPELKQRVKDLGYTEKVKGEVSFIDRRLNYRITPLADGSVNLASDMHQSSTSINQRYIYNFSGPIIHFFIKPNKTATSTIIPKLQGQNAITDFLTYHFDNKLICIYSDTKNNFEKNPKDAEVSEVRDHNFFVPIMNVYDSDGKLVQRRILTNDTKFKGSVLIGGCSYLGDDKFMMPIGSLKMNMVKYYTQVSQLFFMSISK